MPSQLIPPDGGAEFANRRRTKRGRCRECKKRFNGLRTQIFCSIACKQKNYRERKRLGRRPVAHTTKPTKETTT
jgi:hypothetical protein